ncbi:MAG TPA: HTH-type transcriptional activator IlvY [Polyangiaceae bacterium]|nr:HTH-type transcriptional activator IlvY [Polyangiaceae bacterium]
MDYDDLRLFLHLSRTLHFGRTSRECHISTSALSRSIQRLEAELGQPLFERDQRKVELTRPGADFQEHAAETLARYQSLKQRLAGGERLTGAISIFASVTACQSFLPRVLSSFRRDYPEVQLRLETGYAADALGMLASGAVDVAVAALPDKVGANLSSRVLLVTPLVFVAPAFECEVTHVVERRPLPWQEVPLVLPSTGIMRQSAERWLRRRHVSPKIYSEVPGNEAILSLVSLGCGVGIVPRIVMEKSALRAELRVLDVEPRLGELRIGVCTQRRKLRSPIVRAFWDSIDTDVTLQ